MPGRFRRCDRPAPSVSRGCSACRSTAKPPAGLNLPQAGQIMLITGASGSGKSSLLRALARRAATPRVAGRADEGVSTGSARRIVDVNRIHLKRVPCIDQFGPDVSLALDLLNRVGLGEACTYLQLPRELSDGQRWRLRLAVGLGNAMTSAQPDGSAAVLVADEFCAVLDRVTAAVVARALRRMIDRLAESRVPIAAIVATSRDDLEAALRPDVIARCDFGSTRVEPQRRALS